MPKNEDKPIGFLRVLLNASVFVFEKFSKLLDSVLYNRNRALAASLLAAVLITGSVNYQEIRTRFFNEHQASIDVPNVPVETLVDSDRYEVKGVPGQVDVTLTGDPNEIREYRNKDNMRVVVDLRQRNSEGDVDVDLEVANLPDTLRASVNPQTITVTLAAKVTRDFSITTELMVSGNQKASDFEVSSFKDTTVRVTGSESKIDSIRSVKAVIDASGQTSNFETNATLVAYDATGNTVDVT
ncbi:MAG: hypothetical protein J6D18_04045, partial [Erysipelotrichaceae bacterium]|nr:hypothetical protein [Erysipelotrichaceae bacterium]